MDERGVAVYRVIVDLADGRLDRPVFFDDIAARVGGPDITPALESLKRLGVIRQTTFTVFYLR